MKIISLQDILPSSQKSVVTVGNFDGVHRGHSILIHHITRLAREKDLKSVVVTFNPHTRSVLYPELPQMILTTFEEKATLIGDMGVDYLLKVPFDEQFRRLSPEQFLERILINQLHASYWVMGEGHSVGKDRSGGKKFLHSASGKYHITIFTADLDTESETVISSTQIRKLIVEGRIADAVAMLGHPYLISAERTEGVKIGTRLGYPTLNFKKPSSHKVIPPAGVYAAELQLRGKRIQGALYFGDCPTYSKREIHFEFHAFNLGDQDPLMGETVHIWLHRYIRADIAFSDECGLVDQITQDINEIRNFFSQEIQKWL
ncbi:MAG: riboflavin biosynthesis protein RibF [Chitinispirillaceae bacterium]